MSVTLHFNKDQARKFCEEFGFDWHWSYALDERDPALLEMEKYGRYFSRVKVRDVESAPLATSGSDCCSPKKHPAGKTS